MTSALNKTTECAAALRILFIFFISCHHPEVDHRHCRLSFQELLWIFGCSRPTVLCESCRFFSFPLLFRALCQEGWFECGSRELVLDCRLLPAPCDCIRDGAFADASRTGRSSCLSAFYRKRLAAVGLGSVTFKIHVVTPVRDKRNLEENDTF